MSKKYTEYGNFMEVPLSYLSDSKKSKKAFSSFGKYIGKLISKLDIDVNDIKDFTLIANEPFDEYYDNILNEMVKLEEPKFYIGFKFEAPTKENK